MQILIATDKFKGSLTGPEVSEALASGISGHDTDAVAVADGGEGTVDAALTVGFQARTVPVSGPTGETIDARFAVRDTEAVIEMAAASGLDQLPDGEKAPLEASSRGTGELIGAALDAGCDSIVLGVGGSANTDGGAGLLAALGVRLLDGSGQPVADGGAGLRDLARVELDGLDPRLKKAHLVLASDVDNPLLGRRGAAAVFGPQKGASSADVELLDSALAHFAQVLEGARSGVGEIARQSGAGAAGGVGFAALVLGAERRPGTEVVQELTDLTSRIESADLVVTGEGSLDEQSLGGKAPIGVANAARSAGKPVIAVCGRTTLDEHSLHEAGFIRTFALSALEPDVSASMANAASLLRRIGQAIDAEAEDIVTEHYRSKEQQRA